jgi:transposase InsO family protein
MNLRRTIAEADLSTLNVAAFCRDHGISRDRFYAIRRRYTAEGPAGLEPRSRAPRRVANRTDPEMEDLVVGLRKELVDFGADAGAATISFKLARLLPAGTPAPSEATIWRILTRRGFIVPDPQKAPKGAGRSFAAERANECWQIDDTEWLLGDGTAVKIINVIDDCTRLCTASRVVTRCTGDAALQTMAIAASRWGWPERFLSDNAKAYRLVLGPTLGELGIAAGHSRPYHPQTCGKVERFHQTLQRFLDAQPPAASIDELQAQLDRFCDYYNHHRPHRSLGREIPARVWARTPKSGPTAHPITEPPTVSINTVRNGAVQPSRRLVIAVGAAHDNMTATTVRSADRVHVFIEGRLVRALTIDPTKRRQPLYDRPGRPPRKTDA